jgi:hypothetical protein
MPRKLNPESVAGRIRALLESCPTLTNAELYEAVKPSLGNVNPGWLRVRICDVRGQLRKRDKGRGR